MTNDFFNVVDNIINVDTETLQESQESSNTSAMLGFPITICIL